MGIKTIQDSTLTAIAKAIREKSKTINTLTPLEMPEAIANIPTGIEGLSYDIANNPQVIVHGLGYRPSVTVTNKDGEIVNIRIKHLDETKAFSISWNSNSYIDPIGGKIYVI